MHKQGKIMLELLFNSTRKKCLEKQMSDSGENIGQKKQFSIVFLYNYRVSKVIGIKKKDTHSKVN